MEGMESFIAEARAKGVSDEKIRKLLLKNGWDEMHVDVALLGIEVPKAPDTSKTALAGATRLTPDTSNADAGQPAGSTAGNRSISALQASLHHVLLWVFTATSTVMIGIVASALFGRGSGSSESLLTYIVMEIVTFVPFAVLFYLYFRQLRKDEWLGTGRVWSIITIVLHSIGLIAALITMLLAVLLVHNENTKALLVGGAAVAVMNALVIAAYSWANFSKRFPALRRRYLLAFPLLLLALISAFGVLALMRVGPLREDDQKRQALVDTVKAVKEYTDTNKRLPATLAEVPGAAQDIRYKQTAAKSRYTLCADFNQASGQDPYFSDEGMTDAYIEKYNFGRTKKGENCWTITASQLYNPCVQVTDTPIGAIEPREKPLMYPAPPLPEECIKPGQPVPAKTVPAEDPVLKLKPAPTKT